MTSPTGDDIVVKKNDLINSSYFLTLNEQRLLLGCIAQVDSMGTLDGNTMFHLYMTDMVDLFSITSNSSFYLDMKKAARRLYNRNIVIRGKGKRVDVRWITKKIECDGSGVLSLRFSPEVIPYLSEITGAFTKYKLKWVSKFKRVYSLRLYELMQQWKGKGSVEIEVDELRELLSMGAKYKEWSELKRQVIDKSLLEINKHSNLSISYGTRRRGHSVHSVQFKFRTKKSKTKQDRIESKSGGNKDIAHLARPGESWDELKLRLRKEK